MAVYFETENPEALLKEFNRRIEQKEPKGKITTWSKEADGNVYTHKSDEWKEKAWFTAVVDSNRLRFNISPPKGETLKRNVYGYYHGHLIETFLNHFDKDFSEGAATALATSKDKTE